MRNVFIKHLVNLAKSNKKIVFITADLGFGVVEDFAVQFPDRFMNTGITEQSTISLSAGLASTGFRPFVYSIANFPTFRAFEQSRNDLSNMNLDVCIVALGEGFSYGTAGYSHHLIEDISAFRGLAAFSIYSPTRAEEVRISVDSILSKSGPSLLRLGKLPNSENNELGQLLDLEGFSQIQEGSDGVIIFHGGLTDEIISARNILGDSGKNLAIYTCYFFNEANILKFLRQNLGRPLFIIEEHIRRGGLGSVFLETANDYNLDCKIHRIGIEKVDPEIVGNQEFLRKAYGLDASSIANFILNQWK